MTAQYLSKDFNDLSLTSGGWTTQIIIDTTNLFVDSFGGDYFMRLLQMERRISFDYTCGGLQELILSNCRWGIDSRAKIHDLPSYNKIKSEKRKIVRANKNTIWLQRISYPFNIKTKENLKGSVEGKQVDLIKVKGKYYIKRFLNEFST